MTKKADKVLEKEIATLKSLIMFRMEEYEDKYKDRYFEMENEELKLYEEKINHFYLVLEMARKLLGLAPKEGLELYVYIYRNIDEQIFNEYYFEIPYSLREYLNAETAIPAFIEFVKQGGFGDFFLDDCIVYSLKDFVEQRDFIVSSMWEIINGEYPKISKKIAEHLLYELDEVEERKYKKI